MSCVAGRRKIILLYHNFCSAKDSDRGEERGFIGHERSMPINLLKRQLDWLSQFADFVSLDEIIAIENPHRWKVAVTLDDGYRNNATLAIPVFEKFGIPVTWFVATKFVENSDLPWWDLVNFMVCVARPTLSIEVGDSQYSFDLLDARHRTNFRAQCRQWFQKAPADTAKRVRRQIEESLPDVPNNAFADRQEVIEASRSPLVSLGGHTVSHPNLNDLSPTEAHREIIKGKEQLEAWTAQAVRWFAYPYGERTHWNSDTKRIVEDAGFDGAVTTVRAYADQRKDRYEVPRLTVPNTRSLWKTKAWILATNTCRELHRLKQNWTG